MRIPNKFNGYMSDGRRLYPDPATSAIIASSLASAGTAGTAAAASAAAAAPALTAAAVPGLTAAAAPALTGAATTAATNLGTTAALEASKQGIIQAGAQQAGVEAAKQAGVEAAKQVGTEAAQQGIMQGAQNTAQQVTQESIKNGLNNVNNLTANLNGGTMTDAGIQNVAPEILAPKPGVTDAQVQSMVNQLNTPKPPSPYELTGKTPDFLANAPSPTNADLYGNAAQGLDKASYNVADAAKTIPKDVVGNANLKMPGMPELTTVKPPPNALERGFSAATQFAKDHPYITAGGIMLAQNMMQPDYNTGKKKYSRSGESNFKYTEPSTGEYTPIFEPTPYAVGGPVEQMSAQNAIGGNMMYPQSQLQTPMYSNPMTSRPMPNNVINSGIDAPTNAYTGEPRYAEGGGVTGSGNLNLNVPLNFGGPGIGGANGYATAGSGGGQGTSSSTATGAPSQTAQQPMGTPGYTPAPIQQVDSSAAAPAAAAPQGRAFIPAIRETVSGGGGIAPARTSFSVGDDAADAWVKGKIQERNMKLSKETGRGVAATKADYQNFYNQYYRGYADGGKVSVFERMAKEEETRKKKADAQAEADLEKGQSVAAKGIKPYSRTQSSNTPYAAAIKELQAMGKKYGIQMAAPAKTNIDLMGDQDQIEYAANGGIMHGLGGYSDGGRLLRGPGDGVSDSIPAVIGNKQPARLADGEFVIPARIVSELGNGSTEAGARKLYAMMERVQKRRGKTTGKGKVAVNSKADKHLPA